MRLYASRLTQTRELASKFESYVRAASQKNKVGVQTGNRRTDGRTGILTDGYCLIYRDAVPRLKASSYEIKSHIISWLDDSNAHISITITELYKTSSCKCKQVGIDVSFCIGPSKNIFSVLEENSSSSC